MARLLTRYKVNQLKNIMDIQVSGHHNLEIENISLGGILVTSKEPFNMDTQFNNTITFITESYEANMTSVWSTYSQAKGLYYTGFRYNFSEIERFQKWLTLIDTVHKVTLKKRIKSQDEII